MNDIEFLVCDITVLWRRAFSQQSKGLGVSNIERRIIINIERYPGATQREIAQLVDIEPQNLLRPLDKLLAQGLVKKQADEKDRRINRLFLTLKCKPLIAKVKQIAEAIRPEIMSDISTKEAQQLITNMKLIKTRLKTYLQG